jgi:hypothetical protein
MNALLQDNQTEAPPVKAAAYKIKGACAYLGGLSPASVRRLIDRGLIRRNQALRHIVIAKSELDRFLSQ